jgi:hypothetical protein
MEKKVHLGRTMKTLHSDDFNEAIYNKLIETVAGRQEVRFVYGDGTIEYGFISSENDRGVFVKFSHTLLGFLYTEDAWEATTSKLCDRSQIEELPLLQLICAKNGVEIAGFMRAVVFSQYNARKVPDEVLALFSKKQLETYVEGLYLCSQEYARDWSRGHELLKSIGFVEKIREEGNRKFISLVYETQNS